MPTTGINGAAVQGRIDGAIHVFNSAFKNAEPVYDATLTGEVAHFYYGPGERYILPARIVHHQPEPKALTASRNFSEPSSANMADVGYQRVDLMAELLPKSKTSDPLKLFLDATEDAIAYAVRYPLVRAVEIIQANPACVWDGLSFFSAAHKADPASKNSTITFSNDLGNIKISDTGVNNIIDQIRQRKGANGYLPNGSMSAPVWWVPTDAMHAKLARVLNPEGRYIVATEVAAGVSAASQTPMVTRTARGTIITVPELAASGVSNATTTYYAWVNSFRARRALVVRIPKMPAMTKDTQTFATSNNADAVFADMEFGIGLGDPGCLYRINDA